MLLFASFTHKVFYNIFLGYKDGGVSCYDIRNIDHALVQRKPHCRDVNAVAFCPKR